MKAILRQVRISARKANLIAALVRNKKAIDAINILKYTPKKAAPILKKVIESAIANAENNFKQKKEDLYIDEIIVTEGLTYKRSIPISRGRMHPLLKRTAHITVKVSAKETPNSAEKTVEKVEKAEKKTTKKTITKKQ